MVRVHVWLPIGTYVGHTALTVRDRYISFWPDGEAGKKDLKIKRSQPGLLLQSLNEDVRSEGYRQPITIELYHLDEDKILRYLADLENDLPRYQIARNNCSHIVANALMAGTVRKPTFIPHAGHYSKLGKVLGVGIWTPDQILKYAQELQLA